MRWDTNAGTLVEWGASGEPIIAVRFYATGIVYAEYSPSAVYPTSTAIAFGTVPVVSGQWIHILVEWGSAATTIYVDGSPYGQPGPAPGPPPATSRSVLRIGPLTGGVSDLQIYYTIGISASNLYEGFVSNQPPAPPAPIVQPPPPPRTQLQNGPRDGQVCTRE